MAQIIPLTVAPNQTMRVTLAVNGQSLTLNLDLNYNEVGGFWILNIADSNNNPLLNSIPLMTGDWPAANILGAFEYLQIGSAFVINQDGATTDYPNSQNLASSYALLWDDNT